MGATRPIVWAEGPLDAKIAIVGEAPGRNEVLEGRPFVGEAGRTLNKYLASVGINRARCYITNVVKEHPVNNDITPYFDFSTRTPKVSEKGMYWTKFLQKELADLKPNLVVCLGRTAMYALTGQTVMKNYRGSVLESTLIPDQKCISTYHPASTLGYRGKFEWRYYISFDFKRVAIEARYPEIKNKPRQYYLSPSFETTMQYLHKCKESSMLGFDIETNHKGTPFISTISLAYDERSAISIPFTYAKGDYWTKTQEAQIWRMIGKLLGDPSIPCVAQNAMYDVTWLYTDYNIICRNVHDTLLASSIILPDFPRGLDFLVSIYTDLPYYKSDGKDRIRGGKGPDHQFWLYNAKDSIVLPEIIGKQLTEIARQGNTDEYEYRRRLFEALVYISVRGILIAVGDRELQKTHTVNEMKRIKTDFDTLAGWEVNLRSSQQVMKVLYDQNNIDPYTNRKTGRPTADEKALKRLSRRGFEGASLLLEYRKLAKLSDTYYSMDLDKDNRLRCTMKHATSTGRLSSSKSSKGTGGNLQNLPPAMQEFMLPDPGCVVYQLDLAQAENRIVAYIAPDHNMIHAFENDIDLHSQTAGLIFGIPTNEVSSEPGSSAIGTGEYSERYWGKKANHAFNYGQGSRAFALQVEIPESEGEFIQLRYHAAYPGVKKMHRWIEHTLKTERFLTGLFGFKRHFHGRWNEVAEKAYAFIPQNAIAYMINEFALGHILRHEELFEGIDLLAQVHDSIVFQVPKHLGFGVHAGMITSLVKSLTRPLSYRGLEFHIPCDLKICGKNFAHYTEFKKVYEVGGDFLEHHYNELMEDAHVS